MDITILAALAAFLVILIVGIKLFFKSAKEENKGGNQPRPLQNRQRGAAPRRAQLARNRGIRLRANAPQAEVSDEDNEVEHAAENPVEIPDGKMGAKRRAKLEAKAEKKAQRESEEQLRTEKKRKEQVAEEERKKLEEREQEAERKREEVERKAKEEKQRKEHEEYLKMKEAFSVEEEGFEEGEEGSEQNLLQEFVNYIKENKVVVIEDLASYFKLRTQTAIDRIKDLQNDNILTGVIDDRGKFIYVSTEEMEAVAKFIRQRGRISIAELAENSNKLINLTPYTV